MNLNRQEAPQLHPIAALPDFLIEEMTLDNGMILKYINAGSQELLKLQMVYPAGVVQQNKKLLAFFTGKMLKEGSQNYSAHQIAETFDYYGAFLDIKNTRDQSIIHFICLNKHIDKLIPIIIDILCQPLFPEKELKVMIDQEKQAFQYRMQKGKNQAQRAFSEEVFGKEHPYGSYANLQDYDAIQRQDLVEFFESHYLKANPKIYVAGLINSKILEKLNHHLGKLAFISNPYIYDDSQLLGLRSSLIQASPKQQLIEKETALQTAIRMGKITIDRQAKDFPALALTQTILGGFFGSRLMQNIREDKGYTYGIYSNIQHLKYASVFSIASEVGSEVSLKTMEEINKELKRLREEKVAEEELNLVKNYMSGSLLRSLNGPFALGEMIRTIDEYQLDSQYYQQFLKAIQQTSSEEVQQTAEKYLREDSMTSIRVGK